MAYACGTTRRLSDSSPPKKQQNKPARLKWDSTQVPWDVPVDLFFYREPEELEKAEEAQAPFQEPPAVAVPGWGAEPMAGAAPTPMEGFGQPAVDPTAVPVEYQAPPQAAAGMGGGWDAAPAAPAGGEAVAVEQQPVQEAMPVDAGVPAAPAAPAASWEATPQAPAAAGGGSGWGDGGASQGGGW